MFIMAESKLIYVNVCETIHDQINGCHKLIAFFVIYEVALRDAICVLTFLSPSNEL